MNLSRVFRTGALLGCSVVGFSIACSSGPPPPTDARPYDQQVREFRASKDDAFRRGPDSPILDAERATFKGLPYFPVDPAYRVPATLEEERQNPPVIILMATSKDRPRRTQRVGTLRFTLAGRPLTLSAFVEEGQSLARLFVPFADLTNGVETYEAGRNLELNRTATGLYDLDFNYGYHPYCLYNAAYDCPIPPRENRLPVAIRAGEKLP
jgi:uncharacterized protein (DUF1684 family)